MIMKQNDNRWIHHCCGSLAIQGMCQFKNWAITLFAGPWHSCTSCSAMEWAIPYFICATLTEGHLLEKKNHGIACGWPPHLDAFFYGKAYGWHLSFYFIDWFFFFFFFFWEIRLEFLYCSGVWMKNWIVEWSFKLNLGVLSLGVLFQLKVF